MVAQINTNNGRILAAQTNALTKSAQRLNRDRS